MSSFEGLNLFGSGPARFRQMAQGSVVVANYVIGATPANGSTAQGPIELDVVVRGRLVAGNEGALWELRDAITAVLTDPPTTGSLFDDAGRKWEDMSLVRYVEGDRVDRGRMVSVGYEAVFRKFAM